MKILLVAVNAKYIHSNPAVHSLKAHAKEYKEHIEIAEYTINHSVERVRGDIFRRQPDVVAFSCYIWNITYVEELVIDLRNILPDVDIWLGGPEVSYDPADVLARLPVTGVLVGQGELSFAQLVSSYVRGDAIPGKSIFPEQRVDLDKIPFWYDDLEEFCNRIIYYESSRGCPFSCSYCLSSIDKHLSFRDVEMVKKEMDFFLDRQVPLVKFVDRTFNCKKQHALAIWEHLLEHDNGVTNFHFEVAADRMDEEMLAVLEQMRPGAMQLEIGVQSTYEKTVNEIHRKMDFERICSVVKRINSWHNIHQHLDLIAGLPFEDYEHFSQSFNDVYALEPEQLQLGFLKVLKGSLMQQRANEYELIYTRKPPYEVLSTKWMDYGQILKLKRIEEVLELYYNSGQYTHTLLQLVQVFATPFSMYEALADYYDIHGLFGIQTSRVKKYEILLEFALQWDPAQEGKYRELLIYDLYLREHMKNRPGFGKDRKKHKERIQAVMMAEAKGHTILKGYDNFNYRELVKAVHVECFEELWDEAYLVIFDYQSKDVRTNNVKTIMQRISF